MNERINRKNEPQTLPASNRPRVALRPLSESLSPPSDISSKSEPTRILSHPLLVNETSDDIVPQTEPEDGGSMTWSSNDMVRKFISL